MVGANQVEVIPLSSDICYCGHERDDHNDKGCKLCLNQCPSFSMSVLNSIGEAYSRQGQPSPEEINHQDPMGLTPLEEELLKWQSYFVPDCKGFPTVITVKRGSKEEARLLLDGYTVIPKPPSCDRRPE